jgi:hypothetical protein
MFKLSFDTDNAAFVGAPEREVARILRSLASHVEAWDGDTRYHNIRDRNGNTIGTWKLAPEEER